MTELFTLAEQYSDELGKFLPDQLSEAEAIHLAQGFRRLLLDKSIKSDSEIIDAVYNILKTCKEYEAKHKNKNEETFEQLAILRIKRESIWFLLEAEENTYFWSRHKGKIFVGFCLLCVVIGIVLMATGVGVPFAFSLAVGLFGIKMIFMGLVAALPSLYALMSAFCLFVGVAAGGLLSLIIDAIVDHRLNEQQKFFHSSLSSDDGKDTIFPNDALSSDSDNDFKLGGGSPPTFSPDQNSEFAGVYAALHQAFFPFLYLYSLFDYNILKQGLTYRLENTYGYGAAPYYLIQELNNARNIMNKDDRCEELCRICGVAVARVERRVWEEWKQYEQKQSYSQQPENEINAPRFKPVSGAVAQFMIIEGKDPYKILGVLRYASYAEIKMIFLKKVLECPSDTGADSTSKYTGRSFLSSIKTTEEVNAEEVNERHVPVLIN